MPHGFRGATHRLFAGLNQKTGQHGKSTNDDSTRTKTRHDFAQSLLRLEQVLQNMQHDRRIILAGKCKVGYLQVCLEKIYVAGLAEFFLQHDRIDGRPPSQLRDHRRRVNKLQKLAGVHSNLRDIDRTPQTLGFQSKQVVAEPVSQQADRVADGFGFRRNSEAFGSNHWIVRQEGKVPV